jgi:hypothetical protein
VGVDDHRPALPLLPFPAVDDDDICLFSDSTGLWRKIALPGGRAWMGHLRRGRDGPQAAVDETDHPVGGLIRIPLHWKPSEAFLGQVVAADVCRGAMVTFRGKVHAKEVALKAELPVMPILQRFRRVSPGREADVPVEICAGGTIAVAECSATCPLS